MCVTLLANVADCGSGGGGNGRSRSLRASSHAASKYPQAAIGLARPLAVRARITGSRSASRSQPASRAATIRPAEVCRLAVRAGSARPGPAAAKQASTAWRCSGRTAGALGGSGGRSTGSGGRSGSLVGSGAAQEAAAPLGAGASFFSLCVCDCGMEAIASRVVFVFKGLASQVRETSAELPAEVREKSAGSSAEVASISLTFRRLRSPDLRPPSAPEAVRCSETRR